MGVANSKKSTTVPFGYEWAGTVARARRGGSSRAGRRSALLGVLTSVYANSSRGGARPAETRTSNGAPSDRS